jgi:hypothetical protein
MRHGTSPLSREQLSAAQGSKRHAPDALPSGGNLGGIQIAVSAQRPPSKSAATEGKNGTREATLVAKKFAE